MINVLVPEQGVLLVFSTPEQGGKFKTPVSYTRLSEVESSPPGSKILGVPRNSSSV